MGIIVLPIVYMKGADSDTTLPMLRIIADIMPGSAEGNTTLKSVRTLPAPKARLPSLRLSGTDLRLSSVERTTVGSSIIAIVKLPARTDILPPNHTTNVTMPNSA